MSWTSRLHPRNPHTGEFVDKSGGGWVGRLLGRVDTRVNPPVDRTGKNDLDWQSMHARHNPNARTRGHGSEPDWVHGELNRQLGYDALPEVVSRGEMNRAVKAGAVRLFRGLQDAELRAPEYLEQYISGDFYPGRGYYGNGTYATTDMAEAFKYTHRDRKTVLRLALKPDAKVVTIDDLTREQVARARNWVSDPDRAFVLSDLGRYASARGYDAILIDGFTHGIAALPFYVVLNRGMTLVEADE